jgi:hypothetical protein
MSTGAGPAEEGHEPTPRRTWTWSGILPTRDGPMTQHNSIPSVRRCPGIRNHPLLCFPLGEQSKTELVSTVATNMSLGERGICCCDKKIPKSSSDTLASLPPSKSPPSSVAPCRAVARVARSATGRSSATTSGHHQATDPEVGQEGRRQAHGRAQGLPQERPSPTRSTPAARPSPPWTSSTSGPHPLRLRRLIALALLV